MKQNKELKRIGKKKKSGDHWSFGFWFYLIQCLWFSQMIHNKIKDNELGNQSFFITWGGVGGRGWEDFSEGTQFPGGYGEANSHS